MFEIKFDYTLYASKNMQTATNNIDTATINAAILNKAPVVPNLENTPSIAPSLPLDEAAIAKAALETKCKKYLSRAAPSLYQKAMSMMPTTPDQVPEVSIPDQRAHFIDLNSHYAHRLSHFSMEHVASFV